MLQKTQQITYNVIKDGVIHLHFHLALTLSLLFENGIEVELFGGLCLLHGLVDHVLLLGHIGLVF